MKIELDDEVLKRVLILEDNQNMLHYLEKITKDVDRTIEICPTTSLRDAYHCMLNKNVDLFIVDIILKADTPGDTSGLYFADVMRKIEKYRFTPLVFVTSLEDSKFISYERFHCYSFIEKPFDPKRIKMVISECLKYSENRSEDKSLYFRKDGVILAVDVNDILFFECVNHVLHIHTKRNDMMEIPYVTIKKFLQIADCNKLKQCSRHAGINITTVKSIDISNRIISLSTGHRVEIGPTYKSEMKEIFHVVSDKLCD